VYKTNQFFFHLRRTEPSPEITCFYIKTCCDINQSKKCIYKVPYDIILARIKPTLLSHRCPQQSGFTPGCSTCDRIATLCNIAQRRQDFGHPTFAAFVDLHAAFDYLSQPTLWLLLTRLGITDKIVRPLQCCTTTLLVVFGQVGLTAHGLKLRLVFARAVCWSRIHLPQAWIGC